MQNQILLLLNDPHALEQLYRSNKTPFRKAFNALYPSLKGNVVAELWNERLNFESEEIKWGSTRELIMVITASLLAGLIAKFPAFFGFDEEFFYSRNIGFIIAPFITAYFAWKNKLSIGKLTFIAGYLLFGLVFINVLPDVKNSNSIIISCIHLLVFLWSIAGFAFVGDHRNDVEKRLAFLSFNGDVVVMSTLLAIAAGILSGATIGLFTLIGYDISEWYGQNIIVFGLPSIPIIATWLTQNNPQLVGKISPVIAKIFSPLVLLMLLIYLVTIIYSGKNPYNDREFLLAYNAILVGVMALIFFSIAESSKNNRARAGIWTLLLLSMVTIIINAIALSAIVFRISEWGFTPNRTAVLGANMLMLVNLLLITLKLFQVVRGKSGINSVGSLISAYVPVYCAWATLVTFLFPYIFHFK